MVKFSEIWRKKKMNTLVSACVSVFSALAGFFSALVFFDFLCSCDSYYVKMCLWIFDCMAGILYLVISSTYDHFSWALTLLFQSAYWALKCLGTTFLDFINFELLGWFADLFNHVAVFLPLFLTFVDCCLQVLWDFLETLWEIIKQIISPRSPPHL